MVPDVVEYDQLTTGEQRGGMFFGVWGFTNKLTAMLGVVISGLVLQFSGYLPNVAQSAETLQAIRLFFGPVPGGDPGRGAAAALLVPDHPGQPRRRASQTGRAREQVGTNYHQGTKTRRGHLAPISFVSLCLGVSVPCSGGHDAAAVHHLSGRQAGRRCAQVPAGPGPWPAGWSTRACAPAASTATRAAALAALAHAIVLAARPAP